MERTVTSPPAASFKRTAISSAYVSNAFTTGVTPSRAGAPVFGSRAISTESSGTCFTHTKISMSSSKIYPAPAVPVLRWHRRSGVISRNLAALTDVCPPFVCPYEIAFYFPITLFATTILCTSFVPSKIWKIFASLKSFSTGYSLLYPYPPNIWIASEATSIAISEA